MQKLKRRRKKKREAIKLKHEIEIPEMLDCEEFEEHPEMNCKDYSDLQCIGCNNCKTMFKDNGVGTTFKCKLKYPIAWIHIWRPSRRFNAVKIRSIVYRNPFMDEIC